MNQYKRIPLGDTTLSAQIARIYFWLYIIGFASLGITIAALLLWLSAIMETTYVR